MVGENNIGIRLACRSFQAAISRSASSRTFARPPARLPGVFVITTSRGLVLPEQPVRLGDLREFARLMDVHWQRKKQRSAIMSNEFINDSYDVAMASGALGGKSAFSRYSST